MRQEKGSVAAILEEKFIEKPIDFDRLTSELVVDALLYQLEVHGVEVGRKRVAFLYQKFHDNLFGEAGLEPVTMCEPNPPLGGYFFPLVYEAAFIKEAKRKFNIKEVKQAILSYSKVYASIKGVKFRKGSADRILRNYLDAVTVAND
jgi:hypothetical protein